MKNITRETRRESYKNPNLKRKTRLIYEQLGDKEYTARELATKMYNTKDEEGNRLIRTAERQEVAPRLTELANKGLIEAVNKKYDEISGCKVAVYRKSEEIL